MSSPPAVNVPDGVSDFDLPSFMKYMKKVGKAYSSRARALIELCRFLVQTHEPSLESYAQLRNALQSVDNALTSAVEANSKTSKEADEGFGWAIDALFAFGDNFPSNDPASDKKWKETVTRVMVILPTNDRSWSLVDALKENLYPKRADNQRPERMRAVEFLLLRSLPDRRPIIVKQILSEKSSLQEILWNFSRFKGERRLTLKQNPHFYAHLPTSSEVYGDGFKMDPIEDFRHADKFYVLTDRPSLIYIKTDRYSRCFGNFWCPNGAIIFKDLSGRLEGEAITKASLRSTHWRFCTQPSLHTTLDQSAQAPANHRRCRPILTLECPCENWKHQIDRLPGSDIIILRVCTGRVPANNPLLTGLAPLPPTSERPQYCVAYRTHIHMLDYDSLLNVFHHYRLGDIDNWNRRSTWCKLAHVCRKWRYLLYDSSSLLDMYLLLTNASSSIDSLAHLPPLPLVIDFCDETATRVRQDEERMLIGLQQRSRVRRIVVQAPSPSLRIGLEAMNEPFPILEALSLSSTTEEETSPVLPGNFRAQNLRHLTFQGIGLPTDLSLLASTTTLITLTLTRIPAPCYFPPGHLITQLQGLPHLEELSIGFAIPIPRPSAERELLPAPIPRMTLPSLKRLIFRGVGAYLENLVAQINAPLLERLSTTLFFEVTYALANLTQFVHATEGLHCLSAKILFNCDGASIVTSIDESWGGGGLTLNVCCQPLDWKIDSAAQVCRGLEQVLIAVEELTLDLDEDGIQSDPENAPDSTLWHELLLPFRGVKKLHIGSALTSELADALKSDDANAGLILDLLPSLQDLGVQLETNDAYHAFSTFIETREGVGRRVRLLDPPVPQTSIQLGRKMEGRSLDDAKAAQHAASSIVSHEGLAMGYRSSSTFDKLSFIKYMKNIGRAYRKQALELISICRNFVRTQEQTPESCAELRSVLDVVDDALKSAAKEGTKASERVDEKFEAAIKALYEYHVEYYPERSASNLRDRMAEARKNDQSSSVILNRLKETFRPIEPEPTRIVEFLLHKTLPDWSPTIVKQVLGQSSDQKEILWNFRRFKDQKRRLTLKQNPCFYSWLPMSPEAYGGRFRIDPIENFQLETISVLTDNPGPTGRVYLETAEVKRAFGNVWMPQNTLIFKDVCGKLEGESIVGEAFRDTPNLWYFEERPQLETPTSTHPRTHSRNQNSSSHITAITPPGFTTGGVPIGDWREPIRRMLDRGLTVDFNIYITDRPPSDSCHRYSAPSSPILRPLLSSSDDNLLPSSFPQSLPLSPHVHIPAPSAGPPTSPSSFRTAQDPPLSIQAHPYPRPPSPFQKQHRIHR